MFAKNGMDNRPHEVVVKWRVGIKNVMEGPRIVDIGHAICKKR